MNRLLGKLFGFDPARHSIKTELIAGITSFLTMAYILAVNPNIFSNLQDMPNGAVFTATGLAAVIGTLIMAVLAKKPFGLAPGMGLNAFFVFTVCLGMGYSWQFALTAILIEGIIFILLFSTPVGVKVVEAIPHTLKNAIGVGIGLYIAFIGFQNAGIVVDDPTNLITLNSFNSPNGILFIVGFLITAILVVLNVKGGILIGMVATTIIGIPLGITHLSGFISMPDSVAPIFCKFEWSQVFSWDMLIVVLTFLFIDMFDAIGTVVGVSIKSGMVDENGQIDGIRKTLMANAFATTAGALCGASTTTIYIESATGVTEGGRTGLTSFFIAVGFVIALFFSPLFLAIPDAAIGIVLIIVGVMMMSPVMNIPWNDYSEAVPAFITAIVMPFAYSIADGIMLGMISYVIINAFTGKSNKISPTLWVLSVLFVLRYVFL